LDYVYGLSSSVVIPMKPMVLSFDDRPSPTSLEQDMMKVIMRFPTNALFVKVLEQLK
jgi:hypothetical protein